VKVAKIEKVEYVKSAPMVAGTNYKGAVVKVFVTVKAPQCC
jgi:hypothetical protein